MTAATLRAQVALAEIEAMGLTLGDLLAAAGRVTTLQPTCPTVGDYVQVVAEGYLGDTTLDQVTVDDLATVAEEAARRAKHRRAGSDGRASRESCVADKVVRRTRASEAAVPAVEAHRLVARAGAGGVADSMLRGLWRRSRRAVMAATLGAVASRSLSCRTWVSRRRSWVRCVHSGRRSSR